MPEDPFNSKEKTNWFAIITIVTIIMVGLYMITDLYFDRIDQIQKQSQVIIEG